jgi:hypothetical protein
MSAADVSGTWLSKEGRLVYTITQLEDKFVWRTVHPNGVTETGIALFPKAEEEDLSLNCEAQWNFHSGQLNAGVRRCTGSVVMTGGTSTEILWSDGDHFRRVP